METTKSVDGTVIAYDRTGAGPPLLVAVGALCDRRSFGPSVALTSAFTVYTYDRRGRGDSGDTPPYSTDLEVAETAAAIPGARLVMVEGYDHQIPPEVIAPVLTEFFLGA